jgi:hypothetical protein
VRLNRIATANITDFRGGGKWRDIDTLPPRLADAVPRVDYHEDGSIKQIELHDKVWALTLLLKYLGGFPDERKSSSGEIPSGETRSAVVQSA